MFGVDAVAVGGVADAVALLRCVSDAFARICKRRREGRKLGNRGKQEKSRSKGTHVVADVERLGHPVVGNRRAVAVQQALDVLGRIAALHVDVAGQSRLVARVSDEEDALDSVKLGASKLRESVVGDGSALGVALEDEALGGVRGERGADVVEELAVSVHFLNKLIRLVHGW